MVTSCIVPRGKGEMKQLLMAFPVKVLVLRNRRSWNLNSVNGWILLWRRDLRELTSCVTGIEY